MEQLPRGEQIQEVQEKERSVRQELLVRADEEIAQELHGLFEVTETESETLTHFELNGREWKIENDEDRAFAKELILLEKMRDASERETDYYKKKGLLKVAEQQRVYSEMLHRTIELRREWPLVAEQVIGRDRNNE